MGFNSADGPAVRSRMKRSSIHVAIVDDDHSVCRGVLRLLTTVGFGAAAFTSAEEFLGSLNNGSPDCIIVDLNMPAMTGRELLQIVTEQMPDRPVIILTAVDSPELSVEYSGLGAAAYLLKPVGQELVDAIDAALEFGDARTLRFAP
jgi:FixJ family two-component response regulator